MSLTDDAEQIYSIYPRKKDKRFALASIQRAIERLEKGENGRKLMYCDAVLFLLEAVQAFANSPQGQRQQFTPYPATWMNRSSYLDDRKEWGLEWSEVTTQPEAMTPDERAWALAWNRKEKARIAAKR